jgi:hypothetical protein
MARNEKRKTSLVGAAIRADMNLNASLFDGAEETIKSLSSVNSLETFLKCTESPQTCEVVVVLLHNGSRT